MSSPGDGGEERLLTIKQAARMLSVSEVSLRRWTDAGKLTCLRVGPKRERRFRREDLLAFLETQTAASAAIKPPAGTAFQPRVDLGGLEVDQGSHLCTLYSSDWGGEKLAVPFLADGLRGREVCILIADQKARDTILARLGRLRDEINSDLHNRKFIVSEGLTSAQAVYDFVEDAMTEAARAGSRGIRLLSDMAWCFSAGLEFGQLMEFELRFNQFLARRFPVVSLCQYDARAFSGTSLVEALKCHEDTFRYPLAHFLN